MTLVDILSELRKETARLNEAIEVIERLIRAEGKRRGRPPKSLLYRTERPVVQPSRMTGTDD